MGVPSLGAWWRGSLWRKVAAWFVGLLVVWGVGRFTQVWYDSSFSGARQPYLQMPASDGITLRWNSAESQVGVVRYGPSPTRLEHAVKESAPRRAHEIRLSGLQPATRYFYSVGDADGSVYRGGDVDHYFHTAPRVGSSEPTTILVTGDPGYLGPRLIAVRDVAYHRLAAQRGTPGHPVADVWLTTGDNAYEAGRNDEFQRALFDTWEKLLASTPIWPAYGNHDARRWAFFDIFSFPTKGESGGVPSGSEHYYAFDHGAVHVVMLDSESEDLDEDSPMLRWLAADLTATRQLWRIVVLHHPPYTKGGHDSDSEFDSRNRMINVRKHVVPILEQYDVDLVLSGHSHVYERSPLLACHYGPSDSFKTDYVLSANDGLNRPFIKPSTHAPHQGAVYAVVGSSSKLNQASLDHPAMAVALGAVGAAEISLAGTRLEMRFIDEGGRVLDRFIIEKSASAKPINRPCSASE